MTRYDFERLEDQHYSYMWQEYNERCEYEEEETERAFYIYWHNEEYEDIETIEADTEEEAAEKAEEILPEDAVIDEIRVA